MSRNLVEVACQLLSEKYVYPDRAAAAAGEIRARALGGEYDGLGEIALGQRLTGQLFDLCADKHLLVRLRDAGPAGRTGAQDSAAAWREYQRLTAYRIARVERLEGNVGYIDLHGVVDPALGGRAIAAAMELVADTGALIIDLRRNRGGYPEGVVFWCSYFFPDAKTHLNDIYHRATGQTRQYWTLAFLPGARYLDRPVYLLTSDFTFSGGEDLAYTLQAQGRATLIGQTTRGGAHPTEAFPITDTLEITIPTRRSINPITGTNWEGTGVTPDIEMPAEQAYPVAYEMALRDVLATSSSPFIVDEATAALAGLQAESNAAG
ncbi:interphotoreceptor retinoid-binding protein [Rhizocola hellebori]|uniref:Interphotoreceptor retinoid-binding protein n=1 Tax=Rhizocola hellebori TaxID=1392758 RepID=A0A8J3VKY6_9ACTN|nr:S41 family peptidase [Rhizocola hellebori]GIH10959.1 interphotoreceptor retinoid-binding protein [Rhizocola hellebori]